MHQPMNKTQNSDDKPGFQSLLAGWVFGQRRLLLLVFALLTAYFLYQAAQLRADASFMKMLPVSHSYIVNYIENRADLAGLGNSVRIIVEARDGDIFSAEYQQVLKDITDEVFYIPGVDRGGLQSLWTPNVRWQAVTEQGFVGGSVIPNGYDGSPDSLQKLRENTLRSGQIGRLVANDFKSAIILAPLAEVNPETGERLDYHALANELERRVRDKYQDDTIRVRITGFAKLVGDLINGAGLVALFFAAAFVITAVMLMIYFRCHWCTITPLFCSTIAVIWQLGLLNALGFGLDPYSMLVPFLVFAIGISHAVQVVKRFANQCYLGCDKTTAAHNGFLQLIKPGSIALLSDGVGFFTLRVIDIPVIQELAMTASMGVAVLIVTNLILLPVLLSYTGISARCLSNLQRKQSDDYPQWHKLSAVTETRPAQLLFGFALVLLVVGLVTGRQQKIGDLDQGAPELRADSRYNKDTAYLSEHYATSTDVFVVMVQTDPQQCGVHTALSAVDHFQSVMNNVEGVQSSLSLVDISKLVIMGMNEGNPKWHSLSRNQYILNNSLSRVPSNLLNTDCSMVPVIIFLDDHKADTLSRVVHAAETFATQNNTDAIQFTLAAGNAGIEAATNMVIGDAQYQILLWVYSVVIVLCLLNFRSIKATACIVLPLALTSVLAQALMVVLGIGVKVATLPVIALGVGIGVDYGIYIYTAIRESVAKHSSFREAYFDALKLSGSPVAFTGLTLAVGVGTWIFSPIKFQADMGLMLTFMFFWNMLGALILLPALATLLNAEQLNK